jgi:WD40 repeat protein
MQQSRNIYHSILAKYFSSPPLFFDGDLQKKPNIRKCVEQPFQQTKAQLWDEVTDTLCNLDFIQAKACAKMTYELVRDFNNVMEIIPDNAENIRHEKERHERMEKYIRDLIAYAKGEIANLDIPESITPWSQEKNETEVERIKTNPTRLDRVNDFMLFLGQESQNLQNYAHIYPNYGTQLAWNYSECGPVGNVAEEKLSSEIGRLLLRKGQTRPKWNPLPNQIRTFRCNQTGTPNSIDITPDNKLAIVGFYSSYKILLLDLLTGQPLKILKGDSMVKITPDGRYALTEYSSYPKLSKNITVWDLNTGQILKSTMDDRELGRPFEITPDGAFALAGGRGYLLNLWDINKGQKIKTFTGHELDIYSVSITPDKRWAISGSQDKSVIIWDIIACQPHKVLHECDGIINSVKITPDGSKFATISDNNLIIWDLELGQILKRFNDYSCRISSLSITPNCRLALVGLINNSLMLRDLETGQILRTLYGHTEKIDAVCISCDGSHAVSSSSDQTIILWNLEKGSSTKTKIGHEFWAGTISVSGEGFKAVSGSRDKTLKLWKLDSGQLSKTLSGHTNSVDFVCISKNGCKAVSGSQSHDETIIFWDLETGQVIQSIKLPSNPSSLFMASDYQTVIVHYSDTLRLFDLETGNPLKTLNMPTLAHFFRSISFNGRLIAKDRGTSGCILSILDLTSGELFQLSNGHKNSVTCICIAPDGKLFISGSSDSCLLLWDMKTGEVLNKLVQHNMVTTVNITPDGRIILSGDQYGRLIIWDIKTGQSLKTLEGHTGQIKEVVINQDGTRAISISSDHSLILWDLERGISLAYFMGKSGFLTVATYKDGIIAGTENGDVEILSVDRNILCPKSGIICLRHIYDFKIQKLLPLAGDCPFCGHRFMPPTSVLATINKITKNADLKPEQSPCLELPDDAWEDPGLLGNCPKCGEELKFNPFIAGGENTIY